MDKITDALAVLKKGQPVIVVDNEDRENEGDLIALGENITPETVNFMVTNASRVAVCTNGTRTSRKIWFTANG
ncbi:3,4-dihydroxy-2-butanone-4-phosphate synthase [Fructobacillus evanidus]|uniref:3,4-dihydroxy-2-butanone-4-phosphate synthase n=1 Tax=Fructobacillus evanidus TaxID=3064281 RepID=A0ABN9YVE3_9LACO|nr:3 [Fructobacillus sp. LMG 32999] [Fructobacillus sp. LMG 32999]CAK1230236.1 3 [Fructobacillus sp. LMG 32999] [Fructobacillus sp. LMG 32999]CAK1230336.1 3 [Fructobacillus sp. LMG 32999] [Fructobacillus sp. LMG 32999]CAK1231556.1 3 [Fructobacillus sp. LMG 32999] [Fructobacillus sp. LMG 32999]CAK1240133.1 3 [Fructobacillus sp. LMG 32999] [Fructobacillus sp. LMG 32999]